MTLQKPFKVIFLSFALSIFISIASIGTEPQAIRYLTDSVITKYKIPGAAAAIVTPDSIQTAVSGIIKLGDTTTIKPGAKFHIGSNTKAITAFMIMKQVENGSLKLESTIAELFPEMKEKIREYYLDKTLSDLLSHHAGIRPFTGGLEVAFIPKFKGSITEKRRQFAEYVLRLEPVINDTSYSYSNAGISLAASILEKATGKSWEVLLAETMVSLEIEYCLGFPNKQSTSEPWGHWLEPKGMAALPPNHFYTLEEVLIPAGDISMSIDNYAEWLQINLNGLNGKAEYLQAESFKKLHFINNDYSLGWINITDTDYGAVTTHDGSAGTFYCHAVVIPAARLAIAVMANAGDDNTMNGLYELRDRLIKKFHGK